MKVKTKEQLWSQRGMLIPKIDISEIQKHA